MRGIRPRAGEVPWESPISIDFQEEPMELNLPDEPLGGDSIILPLVYLKL